MARHIRQHPTETPRRKALIITAAAVVFVLGKLAILYAINRPEHVRDILTKKK